MANILFIIGQLIFKLAKNLNLKLKKKKKTKKVPSFQNQLKINLNPKPVLSMTPSKRGLNETFSHLLNEKAYPQKSPTKRRKRKLKVKSRVIRNFDDKPDLSFIEVVEQKARYEVPMINVKMR